MIKIIFIGNSYTFFSDMPSIFKALAEENGKEIDVVSVTKGGRFLWQNIELEDEFANSVNEAMKDEYDVAILQDQSMVAVVSPEKFFSGIKGHCDLLKAKRILLYATWGRKEGSDNLAELGLTSLQMYDALDYQYNKVGKELGVEVSNVGKAFRYVYTGHPEIDVYKPDLSHPSYEGSCLAAMVHYKTVFGEAPEKLGSLNLNDDINSVFLKALTL